VQPEDTRVRREVFQLTVGNVENDAVENLEVAVPSTVATELLRQLGAGREFDDDCRLVQRSKRPIGTLAQFTIQLVVLDVRVGLAFVRTGSAMTVRMRRGTGGERIGPQRQGGNSDSDQRTFRTPHRLAARRPERLIRDHGVARSSKSSARQSV